MVDMVGMKVLSRAWVRRYRSGRKSHERACWVTATVDEAKHRIPEQGFAGDPLLQSARELELPYKSCNRLLPGAFCEDFHRACHPGTTSQVWLCSLVLPEGATLKMSTVQLN